MCATGRTRNYLDVHSSCKAFGRDATVPKRTKRIRHPGNRAILRESGWTSAVSLRKTSLWWSMGRMPPEDLPSSRVNDRLFWPTWGSRNVRHRACRDRPWQSVREGASRKTRWFESEGRTAKTSLLSGFPLYLLFAVRRGGSRWPGPRFPPCLLFAGAAYARALVK